MVALGSTAAAATPEMRPNEDTSSVTGSAPAGAGEVEAITDLQPFTHIAYIPVGADLSSIKIEGLKAVKVATKRRFVTNTHYCEEIFAEPGGSMYCSRTTDGSPVPAYQVTYSFRGQPMASDEYGNNDFAFSVYFRPDELSPGLRRVLSTRSISRTAAEEFFQLTTSRDSIHQIVIDQATSTRCGGNYVDGNWTQTNLKCVDQVAFKTVAGAAAHITVKVDPASARLETAAAGGGPWR